MIENTQYQEFTPKIAAAESDGKDLSNFGETATPYRGGFSVKKEEAIILSDCRDLVLVSSGVSGKIRALKNAFPEIAWEYPSAEHLLSYQFRVLRRETDIRASHVAPPDPVGTEFWAFVTHTISQVDFFVQPKSVHAVATKMKDLLAQYYLQNDEEIPGLTPEQIFTGVPCVVKTKSSKEVGAEWARGQLLSVPQGDCYRVRLVDWGQDCFVEDVSDLKPLVHRFSRLPPLALHCRISNVDINDLETDRVVEFHELLHDLQYFVRVRILEVDQVPLIVDIFHPTEYLNNLGTKYKNRGRSTVLTLPVRFGVEEDYGEEHAPSCDEESEEEEEKECFPWVLRYNRLPKPQKMMDNLVVSHVESARAIFLLRKEILGELKKMEDSLSVACEAGTLSLPTSLIELDAACAIRSIDKQGWVRGVIRYVEKDEAGHPSLVVVQAMDRGWSVEKGSALEEIQPLPSNFDSDPMIYVGRLTGACEEWTKVDETEVLREILKEEPVYRAEFNRSHGPPFRVNLKYTDNSSVIERFDNELEKRLIRRTSAVAIFDEKSVRYHLPAEAQHLILPEIHFNKSFKSGRLAYGNETTMQEA